MDDDAANTGTCKVNKGALFLYNAVLKTWLPVIDKFATYIGPKEEKKPSVSPAADIHTGGGKITAIKGSASSVKGKKFGKIVYGT